MSGGEGSASAIIPLAAMSRKLERERVNYSTSLIGYGHD